MPNLMTVNTDEINIYDGLNERCKLDGCTFAMSFDNGVRMETYTSDANGTLGDTPMSVAQEYARCKLRLSKAGYQTVQVDAVITWDNSGRGVFGVKSFWMRKV